MANETTELSNTEKTLAILCGTSDGNALDPGHLSLLQLIINGADLSEKGQQNLDQIYTDVINNNYKKPCLYGFEHFTRDHQGYIYYKNHYIEHFTFSAMTSEKIIENLQTLDFRCRHLESIGVEVNIHNVIFIWERYADSKPVEAGQLAA